VVAGAGAPGRPPAGSRGSPPHAPASWQEAWVSGRSSARRRSAWHPDRSSGTPPSLWPCPSASAARNSHSHRSDSRRWPLSPPKVRRSEALRPQGKLCPCTSEVKRRRMSGPAWQRRARFDPHRPQAFPVTPATRPLAHATWQCNRDELPPTAARTGATPRSPDAPHGSITQSIQVGAAAHSAEGRLRGCTEVSLDAQVAITRSTPYMLALLETLTCGFGARGGIRTLDLPITSRSVSVQQVPARPVLAAHVGRLVQPVRS
jgi:hypothetical protein